MNHRRKLLRQAPATEVHSLQEDLGPLPSAQLAAVAFNVVPFTAVSPKEEVRERARPVLLMEGVEQVRPIPNAQVDNALFRLHSESFELLQRVLVCQRRKRMNGLTEGKHFVLNRARLLGIVGAGVRVDRFALLEYLQLLQASVP